MEGPERRGGIWWMRGDSGTWYWWNKRSRRWNLAKEGEFPAPRGRWRLSSRGVSEPLTIYAVGVFAAIVALFITAVWKLDAQVLAPIVGIIGAFTGHAAGHAAAASTRGR
jgi:hypothetical protein